MAQAQELVAKGKKKVTQDELEGTTAILNRAINTMRPGILAEMEDLRPLSALLRRAGWPNETTSTELKDAISYGRMVQKYVTDGSGTHDMINAAVAKLKRQQDNRLLFVSLEKAEKSGISIIRHALFFAFYVNYK